MSSFHHLPFAISHLSSTRHLPFRICDPTCPFHSPSCQLKPTAIEETADDADERRAFDTARS